MKVIHILNELKFSGAEIMYVDAAQVFQEKGCDLTVLATASEVGEYAPYFERAGYKIIHIPYPHLKNYGSRLKYYRNFIKLIKDENYDVVHIHSHSAMWGLSLCAWIAGKKSVSTFHAIFHSNWYSYYYHRFLRWSGKKIFKSKFQSIGDSVHDHELKLYGNKTIKLTNWYGSNRFFPADENEKNQVRAELDISANSLVLISVGGCDHNKRHHDIINALAIVFKQIPDILYLHLGSGETEEEEIELARELGVVNHVRFYGKQQDIRKYLIASDIYLMTSYFEGVPITTIESMACKIPAILYDVPGLRDFNKKGNNSILIPQDYRILADKIIYLFTNPDIRRELANNARKMVNEYYDMDKNASKIYELYL